jgi:hypothetical protein
MKNKKIIGLCGLAKSGKDTMCDSIINVCKTYGIVATRYSIADILRTMLEKDIKEKFNINVWECSASEKEIFRQFLVDVGLEKRNESNGKYLTNLLQKQIDDDLHSDIIIITDIRYDQYPEDEVYWVKTKNNGKLVHIKLKVGEDELGNPVFISPPNIQEATNDPLLQEKADYHVEWDRIHLSKSFSECQIYYQMVAKEVLERLDFLKNGCN